MENNSEIAAAQLTSSSATIDARRLEQLRDQFIQNVSHELRTPLAIVRGYAELLQDGELGDLDPEQQQAVVVITNQTQQLSKMVERIGILLSIQTHKVLQVQMGLNALAREIVGRYQPIAAAAGVVVDLDLITEELIIRGDGYHLAEALAGLVENAVKFTSRGGRVTVRVLRRGADACFEVIDTGIGISGSRLGELFDGFCQVDGESARQYGGIGLGLTLARSVAEVHGGHLEVESELGAGSCFRVCLPNVAGSAAGLRHHPDNHAGDCTRLWRVLVVDDEEIVATTLQVGLQKLPDFDVTTATNGKQALQLLQERYFDLLITDYRMPAMDGMSLATHARECCPWLAIVMVTAHGSQDLHLQASRIAIQQILDKPVKLSEIRRIATETLRHEPHVPCPQDQA